MIAVLLRLNAAAQAKTAHLVALNALVLPAALGYLGTRLAGGHPEQNAFWVTGAVVLGAASLTISQVATAMSADRFAGRARLLAANGVSRLPYLWSHLLLSTVTAVAVMLVGAILGAAFGLVRIDGWTAPVVVAAGVVAGVALGSIGAVVAAVGKDRIGVTNAVVLVSSLVPLASPVLYPVPTAGWAHALSLVSPATSTVELLRGTTGTVAPFPLAATVAGAAAVIVFPLLAARCLRWS